MYWLSYGGGVNSTALAVMSVTGAMPEYGDVKFIFADTGNEKPETIRYIKQVFIPYLQKHGKFLIVVKPELTVLARWQKYEMTGSRLYRSCTDHGKIRPIKEFISKHDDPKLLIGIDAGEPHRAKPAKKGEFPRYYPLVDYGFDRDGCVKIIENEGLMQPIKSGCWHCPFMRVREILDLAIARPNDFQHIVDLEAACMARQIREGKGAKNYSHWRDKPATYWSRRAMQENELLFDDLDPAIPCECIE